MQEHRSFAALDSGTFLEHTFQTLAMKIGKEKAPNGNDQLDLQRSQYKKAPKQEWMVRHIIQSVGLPVSFSNLQ